MAAEPLVFGVGIALDVVRHCIQPAIHVPGERIAVVVEHITSLKHPGVGIGQIGRGLVAGLDFGAKLVQIGSGPPQDRPRIALQAIEPGLRRRRDNLRQRGRQQEDKGDEGQESLHRAEGTSAVTDSPLSSRIHDCGRFSHGSAGETAFGPRTSASLGVRSFSLPAGPSGNW